MVADEPATVKLLLGSEHLYIGFPLGDRDVVQEDPRDQQEHFRTGDVAEIFLKPEGDTRHWELYVTPNGRKGPFLIPGRGRQGLPSCLLPMPGLLVAPCPPDLR